MWVGFVEEGEQTGHVEIVGLNKGVRLCGGDFGKCVEERGRYSGGRGQIV